MVPYLRVMLLHAMVRHNKKLYSLCLFTTAVWYVLSCQLLLGAVTRLKADNPLYGSSLIEYVSDARFGDVHTREVFGMLSIQIDLYCFPKLLSKLGFAGPHWAMDWFCNIGDWCQYFALVHTKNWFCCIPSSG